MEWIQLSLRVSWLLGVWLSARESLERDGYLFLLGEISSVLHTYTLLHGYGLRISRALEACVHLCRYLRACIYAHMVTMRVPRCQRWSVVIFATFENLPHPTAAVTTPLFLLFFFPSRLFRLSGCRSHPSRSRLNDLCPARSFGSLVAVLTGVYAQIRQLRRMETVVRALWLANHRPSATVLLMLLYNGRYHRFRARNSSLSSRCQLTRSCRYTANLPHFRIRDHPMRLSSSFFTSSPLPRLGGMLRLFWGGCLVSSF